jgi:hypothetical protein
MTLDQVESRAVARLRQCTVLDETSTTLASGDDLGTMPRCLKGWESGLGWHTRGDIQHVVVREPHLFRQHSDGEWRFRSSWVKSPQDWCQLRHDCEWPAIPRQSARVPGWVEKGIFSFSNARGVMPQRQEVRVAARAQVDIANLSERCGVYLSKLRDVLASWIYKRGLWCRAKGSRESRQLGI